jgi:hypothetical protein
MNPCKVLDKTEVRTSTRRAVESAIESSKRGKNLSWRELLKENSSQEQQMPFEPAHGNSTDPEAGSSTS